MIRPRDGKVGGQRQTDGRLHLPQPAAEGAGAQEEPEPPFLIPQLPRPGQAALQKGRVRPATAAVSGFQPQQSPGILRLKVIGTIQIY